MMASGHKEAVRSEISADGIGDGGEGLHQAVGNDGPGARRCE